MPCRARTRLTACLAAAAATTALGVALAPAGHADEPDSDERGPGTSLISYLGTTNAYAPSVIPNVPPFGRKLG